MHHMHVNIPYVFDYWADLRSCSSPSTKELLHVQARRAKTLHLGHIDGLSVVRDETGAEF